MIRIRKAVRFLIVAVLLIALFAGWQTGTLCSVGYDAIAYICPLGALETIFGSWAFVPRVLICLAVVVIVALVFGKAFCSWVCPVAPLSDLLRGRKAREKDECERTQAAHRVLERWSDTNAAQAEKHKPFRSRVDGRHVVLAGSLASAAVCGFPVFCLVCPIGLTFASAIALYRLIGFNEPAIEVLVFPALLVLELTVLRKWCHRFCPVGALLSLLSRGNRTFKPHVDASMCARHAGSSCAACAQACPEHIDPCADLGDRSLAECTRCGACVNTCPAKALSFVNRKE
ncbi:MULTISPECIES: 4Fe-4S binding protein [Coriobacteriia]|uniref:4Fe-4S binding protein n=1 Tax=Coriobacteriia TaxID=84998 RepID=UPI000E554802|nr:4Fe-4S binding protein [Eggerthella sp. AM16-19]RHO42139.1 4Fe-4S binding protein [Eggerthella sp. AM16-19]